MNANEAAALIERITSKTLAGRPLTQIWIARQLGVTVQTVTRWHTGESMPREANLAALIALVGRVENAHPLDIHCEDVVSALEEVCEAYHVYDVERVETVMERARQAAQEMRPIMAERFPGVFAPGRVYVSL